MKAVSLLFLCGVAYGQNAFEAASVKPAAPAARLGRAMGGPGTGDPGRIHYPAIALQGLILAAYDANVFQIAGPGWLEAEKFDVDATLPANTTKEQFRLMLQQLLSERFGLALHRETRDVAGYELGTEGYFVPPPRAGVFLQMTRPPGARSTFRQVTMHYLAKALQGQLKRPVADGTGLTAKYDFVLDYSMEGLYLGGGPIPVSPGSDAMAPPDVFSAVQEQLGLKLEAKKIAVSMIVIDHVEKTPTGN